LGDAEVGSSEALLDAVALADSEAVDEDEVDGSDALASPSPLSVPHAAVARSSVETAASASPLRRPPARRVGWRAAVSRVMATVCLVRVMSMGRRANRSRFRCVSRTEVDTDGTHGRTEM
jgi:hypothetical protein